MIIVGRDSASEKRPAPDESFSWDEFTLPKALCAVINFAFSVVGP